MNTPAPATTPTGLAAPASLGRRLTAAALWDARNALAHGEQLLLSVVIPCMTLIVLHMTDVVNVPTEPGQDPLDVVTPGIIALAILSSSFTGQAIATGFDRRADVLAFFATTPLGRSGFIGARCASLLIQQAVQIAVISTVALVLGWRPAPLAIVAALPVAVVGSAALAALALALAGALRAEAVLAVANLLWVLLAAVGVVLPLDHTGNWWAHAAHMLPATALADGLRTACTAGTVDIPAVLIVAAWAALGLLLAQRWFSWRS